MQFDFATANAIRFGPGTAKTIASLLPAELDRIFLISGSDPLRYQSVFAWLEKNGFDLAVYSTSGEPTIDSVNAALSAARSYQAACVVALGGGSVIDTGKAVAALLPNPGPMLDYLEGVGRGKPLERASLPFMAIPTTAGSGSEATRNSVIAVPEAGRKVSLRSAGMLPRWAVVDPELTYHLPRTVAAYSGLDALVQNLEAYLSRDANPLSDGIARSGIQYAARSLRSACGPKLDPASKADLCVASLCGGIALSNARLGSVHGLAGALGGMIPAPHGAICASLLVHCFKANLHALSTRQPQHPSLEKMRDLATLITGNPEAKATYAVAWLDSLVSDLEIPRLGKLGLSADQIGEVARKAAASSSMAGNPIELSRFEVEEILEESL